MSNLLLRIITALLLLPIVIYAFLTGGLFLLLLLALVSLFCSFEIAGMIRPKDNFFTAIALFFWLSLFIIFVIINNFMIAIIFMAFIFLINNSLFLFNPKLSQQDLEKISTLFYFIFYVTIAMSSLFWLSHNNINLIFLACIATWSNDSCAYFGGRAFGKHKLFERVSAKKTWEGFISGALGSLLIVLALAAFKTTSVWHPFAGLSLSDILWITLPTMILAPLGDLIESVLKRIYNTKDSSNILPGHGGLLDRIDALLLVIPWTAAYAFIIRPL